MTPYEYKTLSEDDQWGTIKKPDKHSAYQALPAPLLGLPAQYFLTKKAILFRGWLRVAMLPLLFYSRTNSRKT